jgi:hypothetical protein
MGRQFDIAKGGRPLKICVLSIDEAWELWLCEGRHRLARVAIVSVDMALEGWRKGSDVILLTVETVRSGLTKGEILVPAMSAGLPECPG